ncbi:hypothetical protein LTR47_011581 [Exophiala xenobiotica]|nr:hypothetical protein LTR92_011060 [Exophiala xenobiotica]KAK5215458.1 hypothetical protein LTR72_011486 [Exophiala xenobiotica]KAK5219278.1 hypothetical protein LTR47_011581 [Exophiala xenobiotica]KAK5244841.1 hypothetical protein LTS06_009648 [Exophiala xenobiotica]KAK5261143.1 hypothetical protein LTR40_002789 [Exophiala xenobiotica]
MEVIGAISVVISIIDASIKIYESAQKDLKLSENFKIVGSRLTILLDTLQTCKSHLQPVRDSLPADVCEALEKTLEACDEKAGKLRQIFQDDKAGTGKAYLIAELLTQQVQHIAAEQMYMLTLAGYEKALGANHTSTLNTVNNLWNLYRAQGNLGKAGKMYQRALAGYEKALGADHTSTLNTVDNLGNLYADQDKLDGAERMYRRALQGFQKSLGADHPSIVTVRANLKDLQARFDRATRLDSTQNVELSTMTDNKKWWKFKTSSFARFS